MSHAALHQEVLAVQVRHTKSSKQEIRARLACAKLEKALLVAKDKHDMSKLQERTDKQWVTTMDMIVRRRQKQACSADDKEMARSG